MKKFIFICIVAMGMLSCSTDQTNDANLNEADALKMESVLKSNGDQESQKVVYRLLNENEKFLLWKNRFDVLSQESQLKASQRVLFRELRDRLKVSFFSDTGNDEKEYFKNIFVPNYLERLEDEFTFNEINLVFYSLNAYSISPGRINELQEFDPNDRGSSGDAAKDCNCNKGSLFGCGASQSCGSRTCESSSTGCGFLWAWECNGNCNLL
ncbi:MAG: hypothetical protein EOO46_08715 [Flavobacterium sp.]|nr:MAG: hypothetical protein EOO46_08715 [Flavobacterium sp.]